MHYITSFLKHHRKGWFSTWSIIPLSKWLIILVSESSKWEQKNIHGIFDPTGSKCRSSKHPKTNPEKKHRCRLQVATNLLELGGGKLCHHLVVLLRDLHVFAFNPRRIFCFAQKNGKIKNVPNHQPYIYISWIYQYSINIH